MNTDALISSVRAFVDRFNAGDRHAVQRHIAREFYEYVPGEDEPTATEVWAALTDDLRSGLPDLHVAIEELGPSGEGDVLTGRVTVSGTHSGPLWGAPPTGASVRWEASVSIRPADGGFAVNVEGFTVPDMIGLLRQMELINPPDQMDQPPMHPNAMIPDFLLRVAFNGQVANRPCSHLDEIVVWDSGATVCPQCVASGDVWPALRLCMSCGFVGCCDTSKNTHMKRHAESTGHALMCSIRPGEGWMWCYTDNAFFDMRTLERLRAKRAGA